jgi:hypothetical protein
MKEIINTNKMFQYHGYQEWYFCNKLSYRGNRKKDIIIGYSERHKKVFGNIETNFNIR